MKEAFDRQTENHPTERLTILGHYYGLLLGYYGVLWTIMDYHWTIII